MSQSGKKMSRRSERTLAFKVLYGLGFTPAKSESDLRAAFDASPDKPAHPDLAEGYAWTLVKGVWSSQERLDATIAAFSQNWRVERLGKVEAAILRIAFFELLQGNEDVPPRVVINEAIELSKQYSDHKSRSFVNGVLDAAAKALENGALRSET